MKENEKKVSVSGLFPTIPYKDGSKREVMLVRYFASIENQQRFFIGKKIIQLLP